MGARNTPEQQRGYNAAYAKRIAKEGYQRRGIIVHRDDWPKVQKLLVDLRQARKG